MVDVKELDLDFMVEACKEGSFTDDLISQDLEALDVGLPTFELNDPEKDNRYEGDYSDFIYNGEYRITFYARNENGNVTVSPATKITVSGGLAVPSGVRGDVNGDGEVNLADAILALKIACGVEISGAGVAAGADVDGDGKIWLAEVINILQKIAELRK